MSGDRQTDALAAMNRRLFLAGVAGTALSAGVQAQAQGRRQGTDLFGYGVASGDPTANSVVLWTALACDGPARQVQWRIRRADDGSLVRRGMSSASAASGWTVKVNVAGLEDDRAYLYDFVCDGSTSPQGRTRTLPASGRRPVRFAVFSCSRYASGWFHAYRHAAQDSTLDFALHLGDYIYEGGNAESGQARRHEPSHELFSLADYRTRHAQHKADADLQALHAAMPMLAIWDDHEFADDASHPGSHTSRPALWSQRLVAARQAYFEWMPMLPNADGGLWGSKRIGDLIDLHLLDTRIEARADQMSPDNPAFRSTDRHMLGLEQERWLARSLAAGSAPWTVVLSSVILSKLAWPEQLLDLVGKDGPSWGRPLLQQRIARSKLGAGNNDAWDGYPAAQERLVAMLEQRRGGTLVLSGDSHSSWSFRLGDEQGDCSAWEVGVPSVTTEASLDSLAGAPEAIEAVFKRGNPHLDYLDPSARGYVVVEIDAGAAHVEWRHVSDVTSRTPSWRVGKRMRFSPDRTLGAYGRTGL